jgi:large subunit ribosomal protein L18
MIIKTSKNEIRKRIHTRIRQRVRGSAERPRLAIFRSVNHIYAQVIDDRAGHTLAAAASTEKSTGGGGNVAGAKQIGKLVAERAKEKGVSKVVFDRGGYLYHGRIKALTDAARAAGLNKNEVVAEPEAEAPAAEPEQPAEKKSKKKKTKE